MSDRFTRGGWRTGIARRSVIPPWLAYPLALLGMFFLYHVIRAPHWGLLVIGLVGAVVLGAFVAWLIESEIVASDDESVTIRTRWRRR